MKRAILMLEMVALLLVSLLFWWLHQDKNLDPFEIVIMLAIFIFEGVKKIKNSKKQLPDSSSIKLKRFLFLKNKQLL
jgi:hypothetical protein